MERGKIKTVVESKGFGFVSDQLGGADLFFHARALRGLDFSAALVGREVEFESQLQPDGRYRARIVQPIGGAE